MSGLGTLAGAEGGVRARVALESTAFAELTGERSVRANLALLESNARGGTAGSLLAVRAAAGPPGPSDPRPGGRAALAAVHPREEA